MTATRPQMTESYSPEAVKHVTGKYSSRMFDPETNQPEDQWWEASCSKCGATMGPAPCASGMVRQHISSFAFAHTHRDGLSRIPGGE